MRRHFVLWLCMLFFPCTTLTAQQAESHQGWQQNLYIQVGPKITSHLSPDLTPFRPEGGYGTSILVNSKSMTWQSNVRYEIVSPGYHWAFRTGLQYSLNKKQLGYDADNTYDEIHTMDYIDNEWYYFEINHDEQLEYLRVKGIEQVSHYLGVPVELRYYFNSQLDMFRIYALAETDFDFLLFNKNNVNFLNKEMKPYSDQVTEHYANPDLLNASAYIGFGFQVGDRKNIGVGFNWLLHIAEISGSTGMLATKPTFAGSKIQIEMVIPLK